MPDPLVKLILLGDSAVGKSSLLVRFCEAVFDENYVVTIGVDFKAKVVERGGKKLNIQVWDTAGQERFRTIAPAYYRSAMGVVFTYDITDKATYDHVEDWVAQLDKHADPQVQKILVGNKSDLAEHRKVSVQEGEQLAAKFGMAFFETSAKNDENVEDAFLKLSDQVVAKRYANADGGGSANIQLKGEKKKKGSCNC
mmetsp:Transcript_50927/g.108157  ORF Transcript_50927/g.108157 Transcript_50927/m.108157 type:complete len:197 (-) Transcript_50927:160-750(-)